MDSPTMMEKGFCRILVIGSHKARVSKVLSLIEIDEIEGVPVEFLACVAKFDSYEDADGKPVRYLVNLEYFAERGQANQSSSLIPYFEADDDIFPGISGAVVGSGLESEDDAAKIKVFLETISNNDVPIEVIRADEPYTSMAEELAAFRALSQEEKEQVTEKQTLGPGKMAKFACSFAEQVIKAKTKVADGIAQTEEEEKLDDVEPAPSPTIDPDQNCYSCRTCRTMLFGEADLQDPPHRVAQHHFSSRKSKGGSGSDCQSLFLQHSLDWMGNTESFEGKFSCPRCLSKIGTWNWSGAQCSCGTWVVPAVQVPKSKVDLVLPNLPELPVGTVISPFAIHNVES